MTEGLVAKTSEILLVKALNGRSRSRAEEVRIRLSAERHVPPRASQREVGKTEPAHSIAEFLYFYDVSAQRR